MKTFIFPTPSEVARALILHIIEQLNKDASRLFHIAFSGGNGPLLMFRLWADEYKIITPWQRMCIYWVDERCVPAGSPESNYGMMRSLLLDHVPVPGKQVFPIQGENDPATEAFHYSGIVSSKVPVVNGLPVFDMVLLGAGVDGHTSSIFPGQEDLLTSGRIYEPSIHPLNGQKRITLTGRPIIHAGETIFLITGQEKAAVVSDMFHLSENSPAACIAHHAENTSLYLDKHAAAFI